MATERNFDFNFESPALPKWGFALGLAAAGRLEPAPPRTHPQVYLLWSRPASDLRRLLLFARASTIAVTVGGGLLLWLAARRFGDAGGLLAHLLWCFSPMVLAYGSLAKLDAWAASAAALVLWCAVRAAERPTLARAAMVGAAMGLAAATKIPTLGAAPVVLAVLAWSAREKGHTRQRLTALAAACAAGGLIALWAVYGFTIGEVRGVGPLPFPAWMNGVLEQMAHGARGHRKYVLGRTVTEGVAWFYLVVVAVKTTLGAQALFLLRAAAAAVARRLDRIDIALLAFPVLLFVVMSLGNTQHEAYLMPAFAPMMAWMGRGLADIVRAFGRPALVAAWTAAAAGALSSVALHPHHLMFFNAWAGGPEGGPRFLIVGDDQGQDQRRLAEWQMENGVPVVYYTPYTGDPGVWGIRWQHPPCTAFRGDDESVPRKGTYALHAVEVHRPRRIEAGCLDWLTVEPPDERIGYSIYLYTVDRERLDRLRANRLTPTPFWRSGDPPRP